jgi:hypothetical protein
MTVTVPRRLAVRWSTYHARRCAGAVSPDVGDRHRRLATLLVRSYVGDVGGTVTVTIPDELLASARFYGPAVPYLDGRKEA